MDSEKFPHINIDPQEPNLSIPDGFGAIWALQTTVYKNIDGEPSFVPVSPGFKITVFIYNYIYVEADRLFPSTMVGVQQFKRNATSSR